jgi:hypothetical protein
LPESIKADDCTAGVPGKALYLAPAPPLANGQGLTRRT